MYTEYLIIGFIIGLIEIHLCRCRPKFFAKYCKKTIDSYNQAVDLIGVNTIHSIAMVLNVFFWPVTVISHATRILKYFFKK